MKKKTKNLGGRPTKYKPEYCKGIVDFFLRERKQFNKDGAKVDAMPYFEDYAAEIGVDDDTLSNWRPKFPEFDRAYKRCKEIQKKILVTNGLLGLYQSTFAIFTAKNILGWRNEIDLSHKGTIDVDLGLPEGLSEDDLE